MKKWGIVGAMEPEVRRLTEGMEQVRVSRHAGSDYYDGILNGRPVTVVQSGIGKVCAAMGTQILVDCFDVEVIWNTGVAGALHEDFQQGDFAISTDVVQHDFNLTSFGHARGYMGIGEDDTVATRYPADAALRDVLCRTIEEEYPSVRLREGTIATGDIFVDDPRMKQQIGREFQAIAVEMEGGAVAQTAFLNRIPFVVLRGISDMADGKAKESFDVFVERVSRQVSCVLIKLAGKPDPS